MTAEHCWEPCTLQNLDGAGFLLMLAFVTVCAMAALVAGLKAWEIWRRNRRG